MNKRIIISLLPPPIRGWVNMKRTFANKISFFQYLAFRLKKDKTVYWPVNRVSEITHPNNIYIGKNSNITFRPGCYVQGNGGVFIGDYVLMASNVGIISGNHDVYDYSKHVNKEVRIGDFCWLAQGCIILPGVVLGNHTVVGAGSVVTKSFPEGFCVIAGNPAKKIKDIDAGKCRFEPNGAEEFYGYIPAKKFSSFVDKHLKSNLFYDEIKNRLKEE